MRALEVLDRRTRKGSKVKMGMLKQITINQAVRYEIASSWWAWLVPTQTLQNLASKYFVWKTRRKYKAYMKSFDLIEEMNRKIKVL